MKIVDIVNIIEGILSIIVSLIAIWGTIIAWSNGFWTRLDNAFHSDEIKIEKIVSEIEK